MGGGASMARGLSSIEQYFQFHEGLGELGKDMGLAYIFRGWFPPCRYPDYTTGFRLVYPSCIKLQMITIRMNEAQWSFFRNWLYIL